VTTTSCCVESSSRAALSEGGGCCSTTIEVVTIARMKGKHNKKKDPPQCNPVDEESNLTAELKEHVKQGRIFDARNTALKLRKVMKPNEAEDVVSGRAKLDSVDHIIEEVIEQAEHVDNLLHDLHSDDGWTFAKEGKGVTIHFRREKGTSIHTVRAQTQFHNFQPRDFARLCSLFVSSTSS